MIIALEVTKKVNSTLTLLIMIVKVVTVTIERTPDYPIHGGLNALLHMAYYK